MALAFGAALMVGVLVRLQGSAVSLIVIATGLILFALILPRSIALLATAALTGFAIGAAFAGPGSPNPNESPEITLPNVLVGTVKADPRLGGTGYIASIVWEADEGRLVDSLIIYPASVDLWRGDTVRARGDWLNATGELFIVDSIEVDARAGAIERARQHVRATARSNILRRTPGSNGSLALGLIIGDDSGLTADERDNIRASGLSHITAVSGSNVALVIVAVGYLLRALNRRGWLWLSVQLFGVVTYVWIVGTDPPIIRAAIMGSLALAAGSIGRPSHLYTLLFMAGGLMCVSDPEVLSSLAFQLSFTSMVGLALAGDLISRASGTRRKIVTALMSPAGAALLTAPLLAGRFGTFSLGTIPANIMVAPLIAPATALAGFVAVIPEGFVTGDLLGLALWALTGVVLLIAETIGAQPYAVVTFAPLTNAQIVGLYVLLAAAAAPLVPEARLLSYRLRGWVMREPGPAFACVVAILAMTSTLVFAID